MSALMNAFSSFSSHKRKRSSSDTKFDPSQPDWKRKTTSLPIRSPFRQRPASIFTHTNPAFATYGATLTPVDTSEDESLSNEPEDLSSCRLPSLTESQTSNDSTSTSSVKAQAGEPDQDMDMTLSSPARPRTGRARSNDLLSSPRCRPHFVSTDSHPPSHDRIPTPISSHFDHRTAELPGAPGHSFPPFRTNLSPMAEQEGWSSIGPDRLPSPTEEYTPQIHDEDSMMMYDQTSDGMSGLRVNDALDAEMRGSQDDRMRYGLGLDGQSDRASTNYSVHAHSRQTSSQSRSARTARLHMGYLVGCEKCAQKVPGHYSHILWS